MDYEKEHERLFRLFEDVSSEEYDDEEESEEGNFEESLNHNDTDQEFNVDRAEETDVKGPYFLGKDKTMKCKCRKIRHPRRYGQRN